MRTLGIDPGTASMGWGVVEDDGQGGLRALGYGVLSTPKHLALPQRLQVLHRGLVALIEQFRPDTAGIEELFFGKNVNTALAVGHARGVALLALADASIPVQEYRPLAVKQAVVGYGHADKRQVQEMVRLTLGLEQLPRPDDAADALAIAICHAFVGPHRARSAEQ
ncbi:crossover junction endodeoxyribonuclease RuvC [Kallotenue papyrolyticum]|uniref:crossover junction endodeoxyribonuclease RuvC n=1 Tax=Kallotenue papyrolyticum TaxID=1325125 RepID=UPI000478656B|nr:crossover junction endodeoxyribonuclease RuvC [Kallotenue papyrolyticum]